MESQAGIPLLMVPLGGNANDQAGFRDTVAAHVGQLAEKTLRLQHLRQGEAELKAFDALPPWLRHQAVYEEYLRRRREAKERILHEQTEDAANEKRLLMERETTLHSSLKIKHLQDS